MVIFGFGVGFVAWFFGGNNIIVGLIGVGLGALIPRFYVKQQQGKRLVKFNKQPARYAWIDGQRPAGRLFGNASHGSGQQRTTCSDFG